MQIGSSLGLASCEKALWPQPRAWQNQPGPSPNDQTFGRVWIGKRSELLLAITWAVVIWAATDFLSLST